MNKVFQWTVRVHTHLFTFLRLFVLLGQKSREDKLLLCFKNLLTKMQKTFAWPKFFFFLNSESQQIIVSDLWSRKDTGLDWVSRLPGSAIHICMCIHVCVCVSMYVCRHVCAWLHVHVSSPIPVIWTPGFFPTDISSTCYGDLWSR